MNAFRVAVLLFVSAVAASFAEETNTLPATITVDGTTYSNVTWRTVTPVEANIIHRTGAATIPLVKLSPELRARLGYDPQKAYAYRTAQYNAEVAREAREDAEMQKQPAAAAAKAEAATTGGGSANPTGSGQAAQQSEVRYGPVTQLRFSYATSPEQLADGTYEANLVYMNTNTGAEGRIYVTFPPTGLNFMNHCVNGAGPNGYSVYGRPYTAQLQNAFGAQFTKTAYWLVGVNVNTYSGSYTW